MSKQNLLQEIRDEVRARRRHLEPQWFGLGFIQLKLDQKRRLHFWHPSLIPDDFLFSNEYHDHRYDFRSDVLVGEITNHLGGATHDLTGAHELSEVCCQGGGMFPLGRVKLSDLGSFTTRAGQHYLLGNESLHRVDAVRCVTLQTRADEVREKAKVVSLFGSPSANPFDSNLPLDSMWAIIDDLLEPEKLPGYHLADIEKGELGEISKIREELEELTDAVQQGVRVMELVELSDLIGAIEAYVEKHHPGYTLNDLRAMQAVTARAFNNGRR